MTHGQHPNRDSCEDLRDLLREIYFIFTTFLVSYFIYLVTEPEYYEYNSPLLLLQCIHGTCTPYFFRVSWITGVVLLTPLIMVSLWHAYRSKILSRLSDQRECGGRWRLVKEVYREIFLVSIPLVLFVAGAPPIQLAPSTRYYFQRVAITYIVIACFVALCWFLSARNPVPGEA
ncbi:hypothetical protein [Conexivisphaera calida]|uniref:Uncharacterized protein n=1 Tax=Conexivisphaera calida TaxID=1874277 RepID=A0A4P2VEA2_9ARCH|nr:hypothetical protein [Conexivisphaera calida]BBE42441.1 hypothetical protein NAS2_1052 [Conexivisphaera calida]